MEKQSNLSRPVVDRENEKNGKNTGPIRDGQALRQGEIDLSRTSVIPSRKIHEPCTRDAQTTSRKTNDRPVSRPYENGAFATNEKGSYGPQKPLHEPSRKGRHFVHCFFRRPLHYANPDADRPSCLQFFALLCSSRP